MDGLPPVTYQGGDPKPGDTSRCLRCRVGLVYRTPDVYPPRWMAVVFQGDWTRTTCPTDRWRKPLHVPGVAGHPEG